MPEINFRIKIIGGKKTYTKIYVESTAVNSRTLSFKNGAIIPDTEFEAIIRKAVTEHIVTSIKQKVLETV